MSRCQSYLSAYQLYSILYIYLSIYPSSISINLSIVYLKSNKIKIFYLGRNILFKKITIIIDHKGLIIYVLRLETSYKLYNCFSISSPVLLEKKGEKHRYGITVWWWMIFPGQIVSNYLSSLFLTICLCNVIHQNNDVLIYITDILTHTNTHKLS